MYHHAVRSSRSAASQNRLTRPNRDQPSSDWASDASATRCHADESESGFSLAETLVASAILVVALVTLAGLFGTAAKSNASARAVTFSTILATQKIEQLRGLTWGFDSLGLPVSDRTTDTAVSPEAPTGGTGLAASPSNTLQDVTAGYVDYVNASGVQLGGGTVPPAGTAYIRRWMIETLPASSDNTLIIQVLVTRRRDRGAADEGSVARMPEEARLVTVKTRTMP
jgi:type II secretory pathway pseudopilin PulG